MEPKLDLRIQKTYLALTNTCLAMMQEMSFEDIKVKDLCERAMIRKSTFYKHFGDKYELLAFIVKETMNRFDTQVLESAVGEAPADYYPLIVSCVFNFVNENELLVQSAMKYNSFALILNILSEQITPDIHAKLKEDKQNGHKMPAAPEVMAPFFVGAIMESVKKWLTDGKRMDEATLKEQLNSLLRIVYRAANKP